MGMATVLTTIITDGLQGAAGGRRHAELYRPAFYIRPVNKDQRFMSGS